MRSIPDLPNEILSSIVSYLEDSDDWKAFRLICRVCEPIPVPFLFRRIQLSRLKRDRDAFEQIASCPHLAEHVRELVWYELQLEAWASDRGFTDGLSPLGSDVFDTMKQLLANAASDPELFWIPRFELPSGNWMEEPQLRTIVENFRPSYFRHLERTPGLKAFISWPMLSRREISYRGYPISVAMFSGHQNSSSHGGNQGLLYFLLPAIEQPRLNIVDLRVAEERFYIPALLQPVSVKFFDNADTFQKLTSIDFHLNCTFLKYPEDAQNGAQDNINALSVCLREARKLQHLGIRFDETLQFGHSKRLGVYPQHIVESLLSVSRPPSHCTKF